MYCCVPYSLIRSPYCLVNMASHKFSNFHGVLLLLPPFDSNVPPLCSFLQFHAHTKELNDLYCICENFQIQLRLYKLFFGFLPVHENTHDYHPKGIKCGPNLLFFPVRKQATSIITRKYNCKFEGRTLHRQGDDPYQQYVRCTTHSERIITRNSLIKRCFSARMQ